MGDGVPLKVGVEVRIAVGTEVVEALAGGGWSQEEGYILVLFMI